MKDRIGIPSYLGYCLLQLWNPTKMYISQSSWSVLGYDCLFSIPVSPFLCVSGPCFFLCRVSFWHFAGGMPQAWITTGPLFSHFSLRCSLHSTSGSGKGLTLRQYPSINHQVNTPEQTLQWRMVVDGGGAMSIKGREVYYFPTAAETNYNTFCGL